MSTLGLGLSITTAKGDSHRDSERLAGGPPPEMGIIFGALGVGLLVLAIALVLIKKTKVSSYERTTGTVVGFQFRRARRKRRSVTVMHPRVRFIGPDGQPTEFVSALGSGAGRGYVEGAEVPVLFDPRNPMSAYIDSPMELHFAAFMAAVVAVIFLIVGMMMSFVLA